MDYKNIKLSVDNRIATISLNRPERLNAITNELLFEVQAAVLEADHNEDVRVIVLKGEGKNFCAGYDLDIITEDESNKDSGGNGVWDPVHDYTWMSKNSNAMMSLFRCSKPVIAQVHGWAVGGGSDMVLCADIIIASEDAHFGYPPTRVWGAPTTPMWIVRLGMERAKRLLFTGDSINAVEAAKIGMILEAVPRDQLETKVNELANRVALLPTNQLKMMKLYVNQMYSNMGLDTTQSFGILFDGIARHTPEGIAWRESAITNGVKHALKERDEAFKDYSQRIKN
ncbi:crotonase/enoyl-CoA hydratase family protein [Neobacillus sp. Marseille-QA0830]